MASFQKSAYLEQNHAKSSKINALTQSNVKTMAHWLQELSRVQIELQLRCFKYSRLLFMSIQSVFNNGSLECYDTEFSKTLKPNLVTKLSRPHQVLNWPFEVAGSQGGSPG